MAWPYKEVTHEKRVFAPLDLPAEPLTRFYPGANPDHGGWCVFDRQFGGPIDCQYHGQVDAHMAAALMNRDAR